MIRTRQQLHPKPSLRSRISEASNPKRRRMDQPRPSGRPEAKATPSEPSATVLALSAISMVPLDAAVEVEPSLSASGLRISTLPSLVLHSPLFSFQIPDAPLSPTSPAERKCLVFLVGAHYSRAMACSSSKVSRCDVIHTLHYVVLPRTGQPHFSKRLHSLR